MTFQEFINQKVKLVYEDGQNHYSTKLGLVHEINSTHLILKNNGDMEAINLSKILRIELK